LGAQTGGEGKSWGGEYLHPGEVRPRAKKPPPRKKNLKPDTRQCSPQKGSYTPSSDGQRA